jgi:hypothetical protein
MKRHKWAMKEGMNKLTPKENANQKDIEIPCHSSQNGRDQGNNKCWRGCVEMASFHMVAGM